MNNLIESLVNKLEDKEISPNDRMNSINCLIQIKRRENPNDSDLYWLTKDLIKTYIIGIDKRKFIGYDSLNLNRILKFISYFDLTHRVNLLKFTVRELKSNQYEEEAHTVELELNKLELKNTWEKYRVKRPFKLLFHLTTFNLCSIVISILIIPIIGIILFYPFGTPIFHLYDVSYEHITNDFISNHIANCLMTFVGFDGISIKPTGIFGSLLILFGKIMFFVAIFNFFLDKMSKHLIK
jgi:hypothetical protein